jgi:hypothetical protein
MAVFGFAQKPDKFGAGSFRFGAAPIKGGVALPNIAPAANWRLPLTGAYDSGSDSAFVTAMTANAKRTWPSLTLASGASRTMGVAYSAVAAAGGVLAITASGAFTMVAQISADSTDYVDGTWSDLDDTIYLPDAPAGATTAFRTQVVRLPAVSGARKARVAITNTAGATITVDFAAHQLQAGGLNDAHVVVGASLEEEGMRSADYRAALVAAQASADPLVFNYSRSAAGLTQIQNYPAQITAAWGDIIRYVYVGNTAGNSVTNAQPISDDTEATLNAIRDGIDAIFGGFTGKIVHTARHTFRAYSGVTISSPNDGMLPYNEQVFDPKILQWTPDCYDAKYGMGRLDLYGASTFYAGWRRDGTHYDIGVGYNWMRAEVARMLGSRIYANIWPVTFAEYLTQLLETQNKWHQKRDAPGVVNNLPSGTAKAALQARVAAMNGSVKTRFLINYLSTAEANIDGWNRVSGLSVGSGADKLFSDDGWAVGFTCKMTVQATAAGNLGQTGAGSGPVPENVRLTYLNTTSTDMQRTLGNLDADIAIDTQVMTSRSGTTNRTANFVIGGTTQTVNGAQNTTQYANFNGVTPSSGAIVMNINRGAGNAAGVYINAEVIDIGYAA